jgi:spermidine dehydrogenase
MSLSDRELGMDRPITRRDFMNGATMMVGAALISPHHTFQALQSSESQNQAGYYPSVKTQMRGSHPGSFETAHTLRDGAFWQGAARAIDTKEIYDLVVVGGGISGLAAAYFFREQAGQDAKILLLENHDDIGGHAKRNEFHLGGRLQLMNGGTMLIDSPWPYSQVADGLLKKLGIDPVKLEATTSKPDFYKSLGLERAIFFDRETFGADKLVVGDGSSGWAKLLAGSPLSPTVQRDIVRIEEDAIDYMPGLPSAGKKARLSRMSYRDFLLNVVKADPGVIPFYQTRTHDEYGVGIDAEPALDCWAMDLPGFQGMKLAPGPAPRMSLTAAGYAKGGSYRYHFPDGNASIVRSMVRALIPGAITGSGAEDVVTAKFEYAELDRPGSPVRMRLNSTVVRARNLGNVASAGHVEVTYAQGKQVYTVRAKGCVLACWNMVIPYLCPDLPDKQKEALHYQVKVPLVYTSVGIRNWTSFQKIGVHSVNSPGGYHSSFRLNWPVDVGGYSSPKKPEEPMVLFMLRTPCRPGLPARQQHKAGRMELLTTSFETFERKIRDQLARALAPGGFDPARDIEAITVNRWPHGYGYEYNPLFDPEWPDGQQPHIIARKPFGRITIANTDSAATAYTDAAIDQAYRAVRELAA